MALSDKELSDLAEMAAERAVRAVLLQIGIDSADPLEAQKDFYLMRQVAHMAADSEFRKDMEHVRAWRMSMDSIKSKGILTAVGILMSGFLAALWMGFKQLLEK
jgi:hypothetical protein